MVQRGRRRRHPQPPSPKKKYIIYIPSDKSKKVSEFFQTHSQAKTHREACGGGCVNQRLKDIVSEIDTYENTRAAGTG